MLLIGFSLSVRIQAPALHTEQVALTLVLNLFVELSMTLSVVLNCRVFSRALALQE